MNNKTKKLVCYGLLLAVIILMSFTPIGYLRISIVEITLITIPVAIGAIIFGPKGGAVFGGVFGLTSFLQCFGMSPFGVALLQINPVLTFILCVIPRILAGLVGGLVFNGINKGSSGTNKVSYWIASLSVPLTNTVLFVGTLIPLFGNSEYIQGMRQGATLLAFLGGFIGLNGVIEIVATTVVGGAIAYAVTKAVKLQ